MTASLPRRRLLALGAGVLLLSAFAARAAAPAVTVKGAVEQPLALTLDDLRGFTVRDYEETWPEGHGPPHAPSMISGVLLKDVLERAKLVEKRPRDLRKTIVIADARDGYRAISHVGRALLSLRWATVLCSPSPATASRSPNPKGRWRWYRS